MTGTGAKRNAPTPEPASAERGWDPYEVWRTRILLPRLERRAKSAASQTSPAPRATLVRRQG